MWQDQFWSTGQCPPGGVPLVPVCMPGVVSFNGRTGAVTLNQNDILAAGGLVSGSFAPLDSPHFTGIPTAPTAAPGTDTDQLATTAFVEEAIAEALISGVAGVASFNGRTGAVTLNIFDVTGAGGAPIASPTFAGVPRAPTPQPNSNSTEIATTAFVAAAIAALGPSVPVPSTVADVQLTACFQGKPADGSIIVIPITFSLTIAANMAGSTGVQTTLTSGLGNFFIVYSGFIAAGDIVGHILFNSNGTVTFSGPGSARTFTAGSFLTIQAPSPQDPNLADVGISIAATRN